MLKQSFFAAFLALSCIIAPMSGFAQSSPTSDEGKRMVEIQRLGSLDEVTQQFGEIEAYVREQVAIFKSIPATDVGLRAQQIGLRFVQLLSFIENRAEQYQEGYLAAKQAQELRVASLEVAKIAALARASPTIFADGDAAAAASGITFSLPRTSAVMTLLYTVGAGTYIGSGHVMGNAAGATGVLTVISSLITAFTWIANHSDERGERPSSFSMRKFLSPILPSEAGTLALILSGTTLYIASTGSPFHGDYAAFSGAVSGIGSLLSLGLWSRQSYTEDQDVLSMPFPKFSFFKKSKASSPKGEAFIEGFSSAFEGYQPAHPALTISKQRKWFSQAPKVTQKWLDRVINQIAIWNGCAAALSAEPYEALPLAHGSHTANPSK